MVPAPSNRSAKEATTEGSPWGAPRSPRWGEQPANLPVPDPPARVVTLKANDVSSWSERAEKALAAAKAANTPEAWREAGHVSLIVSDVVLATNLGIDTSQRAEEAAQQANFAARAAELAAQASQEASREAQQVQTALSMAREAGTPEAWREAARVASAISMAGASSGETSVSGPPPPLAPRTASTATTVPPISTAAAPQHAPTPSSRAQVVTVPDVLGMSPDQAKAVLESVGLVVSTEEQLSTPVPIGEVFTQIPAAGSQSPLAGTVTITVI